MYRILYRTPLLGSFTETAPPANFSSRKCPLYKIIKYTETRTPLPFSHPLSPHLPVLHSHTNSNTVIILRIRASLGYQLVFSTKRLALTCPPPPPPPSEPVWPSGKALGWQAEGPRFESTSALLSLQKLWSVDTVL